jgi:hypothetical protein
VRSLIIFNSQTWEDLLQIIAIVVNAVEVQVNRDLYAALQKIRWPKFCDAVADTINDRSDYIIRDRCTPYQASGQILEERLNEMTHDTFLSS